MTDKIIFLIDPEGDSIDLVCEEKITANSLMVQKNMTLKKSIQIIYQNI